MVGRLVNCPECGGVTHPFAEQLVTGSRPADVADAPAVPAKSGGPGAVGSAHQVRHCDNCGRLIGRLEESHVWQGNLVCVDCHSHLSPALAVPAKTAKRAAKAKVAPVATSLAAGEVQVLEARRVARAEDSGRGGPGDAPRPPSRLSLFMATKPGRAMLAICTVALGIYFVYSFLQVIGLVANLLVVGLLLLCALFFLFRPGPRPAGSDAPGAERSLARRP
jgi:hypothetical protein